MLQSNSKQKEVEKCLYDAMNQCLGIESSNSVHVL